MHKEQINPWTWQDALGFSQAWRVSEPGHVHFVSGQAPISPEGRLVGDQDFAAQVTQVFGNLESVLEAADATLSDVVKLTVYLTDMSTLREFTRLKGDILRGPQPASTAIGVSALALPGMMVEVEAIAVTG